jgi:hypothetical protein
MQVRMIAAGVAAFLLSTAAGAQPGGEPVHFSKLIPLLPDKVDGFVAAKPNGSTTAAMGFKVSEVSRVYHKGKEDSDQTVTVKITDGTGNQFFAAAHAAAPEFSSETTAGYEKGFKLDGNPAIEKYTTDGKNGSLTVFLGERYLVQVDVNGLPGNSMQDWWKKIDAKKLIELKAEPMPKAGD